MISIIMYKDKEKMLPYNLQEFVASNHGTMHLTRQSKKETQRTTLESMIMSLWNLYNENVTSSTIVENVSAESSD